MPMIRVRKTEAISKGEFHRRLRVWLATDEHRIGAEGDYGATGWIFVRDGGSFYKLNADTKRPAVEEYVQNLVLLGEDVEWHTVENQKGNMTAIAYGPEQRRNTSFYLYFAGSAA